MAAKPRISVRLAPATLHALAYIAQRDGLPPAEAARMMLAAQVDATLAGRGWKEDARAHYRAWLAEQAAAGDRAETPEQADYDALAAGVGLGAPVAPAAPAKGPATVPLPGALAVVANGVFTAIDNHRPRLARPAGRPESGNEWS